MMIPSLRSSRVHHRTRLGSSAEGLSRLGFAVGLLGMGLCVVALAACEKGEPADKPSKETASKPQEKPAAAEKGKPTVAAAAKGDPQAAPAATPLIPKGLRSKVPTVAEYKAQSESANVLGARELDCETKLVREWLRVSCRGTNEARGTAERVHVVKGDTMQHTFHEFSDDEVASLVMRFEPGVDIKAIFKFTRGEHVFKSRWPEGAAEPEVKGHFDDGSVVLEGPPPGAEAPVAEGGAPYGKLIPGRTTIPTEAEYAAHLREVGVTNSTLLQCETKKVREWLRVRCFGTNDARGSADGVRVLTGGSAPGVFAFMEGDAATLIMPFVPNTKVLAEFNFSKGMRLFNSAWEYGAPEPARCGAF